MRLVPCPSAHACRAEAPSPSSHPCLRPAAGAAPAGAVYAGWRAADAVPHRPGHPAWQGAPAGGLLACVRMAAFQLRSLVPSCLPARSATPTHPGRPITHPIKVCWFLLDLTAGEHLLQTPALQAGKVRRLARLRLRPGRAALRAAAAPHGSAALAQRPSAVPAPACRWAAARWTHTARPSGSKTCGSPGAQAAAGPCTSCCPRRRVGLRAASAAAVTCSGASSACCTGTLRTSHVVRWLGAPGAVSWRLPLPGPNPTPPHPR